MKQCRLESAVRYPGMEVDVAQEIAGQVETCCRSGRDWVTGRGYAGCMQNHVCYGCGTG